MPERNDPEAAAEGTFLSHLVELRNRLLYAVIAIGAVFVALLPFSNEVYVLVADPLMAVMPAGTSMIATEVTSPFFIPIKLTLGVAIVLTVPYLLYQVWAFVAPGLYQQEQQLVLPLLVSSTLLFYAGMAFAYFVVFPAVFQFFVSSAPTSVAVMTDIRAYLDFIITMFIAFGIAFEVPVAVVLLTRMGALNPDTLAGKRPYVILGAFVIAAVITPPDIFSQTFLAVPMLLLFEVGLFLARRVRPREAEAEAGQGHREMTDAEMEAELDRHEASIAPKRRRRRRKKE